MPCAIDPSSAACAAASPPGDARGGTLEVGTASQPPGQRYLNPSVLGGNGHPLMTHPKDALPDGAACAAPLSHPHHGAPYRIHRPFTGLWWDHAVAALAAQGALFWPAYAAAGGQLDELVVDWEEGMWGPHFGGACPPGANATAAGPAWPRERLSLSATSIGAWSSQPRPFSIIALSTIVPMAGGTC